MMRFISMIGVIFYAAAVSLIGLALVILSLNLLRPQEVSQLLTLLQASPNSRIAAGISGLLLIIVSYSFARLILGRFQREKTIAFSTSSGQVTIALSAVEDLIRRVAAILPEIKELKPDVIATKKGIMADLRVVLKCETSIPEFTARLQEITRAKIQEALGIEEQVIIKIHVAKIAAAEDRKKKEGEPAALPFGGYERI
jgi:uncharacterized alkaline shock family protein YloU